jgi:ribosomal protein L32
MSCEECGSMENVERICPNCGEWVCEDCWVSHDCTDDSEEAV